MKLSNKIGIASVAVAAIGIIASLRFGGSAPISLTDNLNIGSINGSANQIVNNSNVVINNLNDRSISLTPNFFDVVTLGSNKEYINSILGEPRASKYHGTSYFGNGFKVDINYVENFAKQITLVPTKLEFANRQDISKYLNGPFKGPKYVFGNVLLRDFIESQDSELSEIYANMAGAGSMQCINHANFSYQIKLSPTGSKQKISVGYMAPSCADAVTGEHHYLIYNDQTTLLYNAVFSKQKENLLDLKINYITIEEVD